MKHRSLAAEIMDDPLLSDAKLEKVLIGLNYLNQLSNSDRDLYKLLKQICSGSKRRIKLFDLGSGGGELLCSVVARLIDSGFDVEAIGIDCSPYSVQRANDYANVRKLPVKFIRNDAITALKEHHYDVVVSTLFLHHLECSQVQNIFRIAAKKAKLGVVMIDLARSWTTYCLVQVGTRLISNSKILISDGVQSVKSAFTKAEVLKLASDLPGVCVRKKFPCRLHLTWHRTL